MFDKENGYTLKVDMKENKSVYTVVLKNADGEYVESEISKEIAEILFRDFIRESRNQQRSNERHLEVKEFTEEQLHKRLLKQPESVEGEVERKLKYEMLHKMLDNLPSNQKNRMYLYYFKNMEVKNIAALENCSEHSVYVALKRGRENLKKYLKEV